jgi:hypothetical protein
MRAIAGLAVASMVLSPCPSLGQSAAQPAVRRVVVAVTAAGRPLPFALIDGDLQPRFTDGSGRVTLSGVAQGVLRLRVRAVGHATGSIAVAAASGMVRPDTVRVTLPALAAPPTSGTTAITCGRSLSATDSARTWVVDQARLAADWERALTHGHPFTQLVERERAEGNNVHTADTSLLLVRRDSIMRRSDRWRGYRPGQGADLTDADPMDGSLPPVLTLGELGNDTFEAAHCYRYRGVERVGTERFARVDITPIVARDFDEFTMSVFLDATTYRIRRLDVTTNRHVRINIGQGEQHRFIVKTTFRELLPGVPIAHDVEILRRLEFYQGAAATWSVSRERHRFVELTALTLLPDDPSPLDRLAARADSAATHFARFRHAAFIDSVDASIFGFVQQWRSAWKQSEEQRASALNQTGAPPGWFVTRVQVVHCHVEASEDTYTSLRNHALQSGAGKRAVCPTWTLGDLPARDEAAGLDATLVPEARQRVRASRESLLNFLDSVAVRRPTDSWLVGQRARFAVDQRDFARADRIVNACRADVWWCLALRGYVDHARGDRSRADAVFLGAIDAMPTAVRCAWNDLSPLFYGPDQPAYAVLDCAGRDSLTTRIWWLSDPLWSDVANDRRAEHNARLVLGRLRSEAPTGELWEARPRYGGESVIEMVTRYGWPTGAFWGGPGHDASHFGYLGVTDTLTRSRGLFATAEYSATDRVHVIPAWRAIADPLSARSGDWQLTGPRAVVSGNLDSLWWPSEHFRREDGRLHQLWEQTALFRRQAGALVAVATHLSPSNLGLVEGDTVEARLLLARAPDSMQVIGGKAIAGRTAVLQAVVRSQPYVLGIEAFAAPTRQRPSSPAGRTRFAVDPPPPLSAMRPGEIALSTPAFVAPPQPGENPATDARVALLRMLPNTTFNRGGRIGVYWESYGIATGDTVRMSVRVIGGRDTITIGWAEPSQERAVSTIAGPVPVQSRNVTVDLSTLSPGDYVVEVVATRRNVTARNSRPLAIAGPGVAENYAVFVPPYGRSERQLIDVFSAAGEAINPRKNSVCIPRFLGDLTDTVAVRSGAWVLDRQNQGLCDGIARLMMHLLNPATDRVAIWATWTPATGGTGSATGECYEVREENGRWIARRMEFPPKVEETATACRMRSEWW